MHDTAQWEKDIPSRLGNLMRAIEELDQQLAEWGADDNARYLAQLAVEELGTNIIKYGYDDAGEHTIHLSAQCEQNFFRISLEDDGHEFNPCLAAEPDPNLSLEDREPGGWGLCLVRQMSAGMEYCRRGNKNVVTVLVDRPR